jgi:hypothetical protein
MNLQELIAHLEFDFCFPIQSKDVVKLRLQSEPNLLSLLGRIDPFTRDNPRRYPTK